MKVGQIVARHQIEIIEAPIPEISTQPDGTLLVKPYQGAVCGSDIPCFTLEHPNYPLEIGKSLHECIGFVVASKSPTLKEGDEVLLVKGSTFDLSIENNGLPVKYLNLDNELNQNYLEEYNEVNSDLCGDSEGYVAMAGGGAIEITSRADWDNPGGTIIINNSNISYAKFADSDLSNTVILNSKFLSSEFNYANFENAIINNCNFTGVKMKGANLKNADFTNTKFDGSVLPNGDFFSKSKHTKEWFKKNYNVKCEFLFIYFLFSGISGCFPIGHAPSSC